MITYGYCPSCGAAGIDRKPGAWENGVEREWAAAPREVQARVIGIAADPVIRAGDVIIASYNAG
jgi:hypothetical protein